MPNLFSKDEIEADHKRFEENKKKREFFKIGENRIVVIDKITKMEKIGRKGNTYFVHTYYFRDSEDFAPHMLEDKNFAFVRAFDPVKREYGEVLTDKSLFNVTTVKTGEHEYQGRKFDEIGYEVTYLGEAPTGKVPDAVVETTDGIPF